jgi:periplasmic protein TonB
VANQPRNRIERPGWAGYAAAILVSALGHAGFLVFALLILPNWLHSATVAPPSMTVKIVDNIPAGDLGTHLPKLAGHKKPPPEEVAKADEPQPPEEKPPEPVKPDDDKNAIALNTLGPTPTPTPEPPPPTVAPTEAPTEVPTVAPTPAPTETPKKIVEPAPTPVPPPLKHHHEKVIVHNPPKPKHTMVAKAEKTPDAHAQFRKLQEKMMKERMDLAKKDEGDEDDSDDDNENMSAPPSSPDDSGESGPVVSNAPSAGSGYGVGPGSGSMGTLTDLQYLLYFRAVQQKVKDAWTFPGGSNDLSADVEFSIGADGTLNGVKIAKSSGDAAFDESVLRAIRRAAPFPPPPAQYRSQFSDVVSTFKLGELKS